MLRSFYVIVFLLGGQTLLGLIISVLVLAFVHPCVQCPFKLCKSEQLEFSPTNLAQFCYFDYLSHALEHTFVMWIVWLTRNKAHSLVLLTIYPMH